MTKQETFDIVVAHLRRQGQKSKLKTGKIKCLYRGPRGLKCAAGCLIPDELYSPEMEGKTWWQLTTKYPQLNELGHDLRLVDVLQATHDLFPVYVWEAKFKLIARLQNLVYQ